MSRLLIVSCLSFVILLSSTMATSPFLENSRPVIGILTQPTDSDFIPLGKSYLPSSYVKWVESAGAEVVPVPWDETKDTLAAIFKTINGILLPGGNIDLPGSKYEENSYFLYNLTLEANKDGNFFPLWGTCQGFEQLVIMTSGNSSILENFNSEDLSIALKFTTKAENSAMFQEIPQNLWEAFQTEPVCENLHHLGISPDSFKSSNLSNFYNVLSTNPDRDGKEFISVIEAIEYPIYGVQWHPERNQFEWDLQEPIDTSEKAIGCVQYLANFFVEKCRQNKHIWKKVVYDLIHHYPLTYTQDVDRYYVEAYFWK